jgi:hypothetical protein
MFRKDFRQGTSATDQQPQGQQLRIILNTRLRTGTAYLHARAALQSIHLGGQWGDGSMEAGQRTSPGSASAGTLRGSQSPSTAQGISDTRPVHPQA